MTKYDKWYKEGWRMYSSLWLLLCGVFLFFLLVDIFGHKFLGISRTIAQRLLLSAMIAAAVICGVVAGNSFLRYREEQNADVYLAYCYLLNSDSVNAARKAQLHPDSEKGHDQVITLFADALKGDYLSSYFTACRILNGGKVGKDVLPSVERMQQIAAEVLGMKERVHTDEEILKQVELEIKVCADILKVNEKQEEKYIDLYATDAMLSTSDLSKLDAAAVADLLAQYPEDVSVLKLGIKYYLHAGEYVGARECAELLLDKERSGENYVILTDVIAEAAVHGNGFVPLEDKEAAELMRRAGELEQRAEKYNSLDAAGTEKRDKLLNQAQDLRKEAENLDITRAVNYLISKKPLTGDSKGVIDLQVAKLYVVLEERDKAREYIYKVMDHSENIAKDSPIREPLLKVVAAYDQLEQEEEGYRLEGAVNKLMEAQSQGILPVSDGNMNGVMADFIASTLKYERIRIHIGQIDTANYPVIRAYANINGSKDSVFGLAGDFKEKDFELIDTQYQIQDFKLVDTEESSQVSIAIVMDRSGSMAGKPLEDAKLAASACVEHMDAGEQRLAVVSYDDTPSLDVAAGTSRDTLIRGIRDVNAGGGTNISGGIGRGIDALSAEKGTKAIILLTDGQDGNTQEEMERAIETARQNRVAIYVVGFGEVNSDYLGSIAQSTGGRFILAANSTELEDVYLTLQKYIVNNYCFEYTVRKNPDTDPRKLIIGVPDYQTSADKVYRISGDPVPEGEEEESIRPAGEGEFVLFGAAPSGASAGDIAKGIEVTVTGAGFTDGINLSIGDIALKDIRLVDSGTVKGTLEGTLAPGRYRLIATLSDGRTDRKDNGFSVFLAGTAQAVRLGSNTILADMIGQVGDDTFVASGNVSINGFIHSDADVLIKASALPDDFDIGSGSCYMGDNGELAGNGKLYISYKQAEELAEKGGGLEQAAASVFAELVMNGRDYIVRNGKYSIGVNGIESDFTDTMYDHAVKIPNMAEIEVAKCTLYADRIQIDASKLSIDDIVDTVKTALAGGASAPSEASEAYSSREDAFKFKGFDGSLSMALSAQDIRVGGEIKFNMNNAVQFGFFGIRDFGLKLNTLDADKEYWKVQGSIDFSHIVPGLGGSGVEGFEAAIGSCYWYPDSINFAANLNPGIPIYQVIFIDKIGGKAEGLSNLFISKGEVPPKDVILAGLLEADVNLFKSLKLPASEEIARWGELGAIKDGEIGFNCSQLQFYASADLTVFQQKVAEASIQLGKGGFEAKGGVGLDVSAFGVSMAGGVEMGVKAGARSGSIWFAGDAHLSCAWTNTNWDGDIKAAFSVERDGSSIELIEILLSSDAKYIRFWYDKNSGLTLFDRVHKEVNF